METTAVKQRFTAEKLFENSQKHRQTVFWKGYIETYGFEPEAHRNPNTIQGFLTKEQVAEMFAEPDHDQLLFVTGLCFVSNGEVFFLTDDCLFGYGLLPKDFISCSITGLQNVIGEGQTYPTLNDALFRHARGEIHLNSVQELVDYLNKEFGD